METHFDSIADLARRLKKEGISIIEHHYDVEDFGYWSIEVGRADIRMKLVWHGWRENILTVSRRLSLSDDKEEWGQQESVSQVTDITRKESLYQLCEREIVARLRAQPISHSERP